MKKILVLLIAAIIGFTMMASGASAGTIALTGDQSGLVPAAYTQAATVPTYYPAEALVPATVKIDFSTGGTDATMPPAVVLVGAAAPKSITYKPTTNLPSGTRIVFTLTNGVWKDATYYLVEDATLGAGPVAGADSIVGNVLTFIVGSTPITANTILLLSVTDGTAAGTNPIITMDAALATAGTKVTLAVTECYDAVGPIIGGLANSITLVGSYQQFVWSRTAGADTVNVNSPDFRKLFLGSAATPALAGAIRITDVQATYTDAAFLGSVANFAVNLGFGAGLATLEYTVTGNQLQKLVPTTGLRLLGSAATPKNFTWGASDTTATLSFDTTIPATTEFYNGANESVIFTVNGTDTLDVQNFNIAARLNFANNLLYNDVSLADGLIMAWDINGWQSTIPYMWASATAAEDTFIKIFNNSTVSGEVLADVRDDAGVTVATNVAVGTITAGTVGIFWANDIATLAGLTVPGPFAIVFTVNAPKDSVTAFANQKRPGGTDRVVPVYTGTAGNYKTW